MSANPGAHPVEDYLDADRDRRRWLTDPVAWVHEQIEWRPGEGLTSTRKKP